MLKVDGHTHTEYCPHGSGDAAEAMIQAAIAAGVSAYHITEHTPVPDAFMAHLQPYETLLGDLAMPESEVDRYLKEMLALKAKYKSQIDIKVGFEVDFLPPYKRWTTDFLNEYGPYCETGILSVHYLPDATGWRCVDYKAEDVAQHLLPHYGGVIGLQRAYYDSVLDSIHADLGQYKPQRIGHMTLINKFQKKLGIVPTDEVFHQQRAVLEAVKGAGMSLDYNQAGLFKPDCGETYPPASIAKLAQEMGIALVYGSDAHSVAQIERINCLKYG